MQGMFLLTRNTPAKAAVSDKAKKFTQRRASFYPFWHSNIHVRTRSPQWRLKKNNEENSYRTDARNLTLLWLKVLDRGNS